MTRADRLKTSRMTNKSKYLQTKQAVHRTNIENTRGGSRKKMLLPESVVGNKPFLAVHQCTLSICKSMLHAYLTEFDENHSTASVTYYKLLIESIRIGIKGTAS